MNTSFSGIRIRRSRVGSSAHRTLLVAAATTVTLLLTACGSSVSADTVTADTRTVDTVTADTRTVDTAHGEIDIPAHPERIVSVHAWATETLFDLGIEPIGVDDSGARYVPNRYLERWNEIDKVTDRGTVDFEKIAALHPDLIVGVDAPYLREQYKNFTAIAPTAFAPFDESTTWQSYPEFAAQFVDAQAELGTLRNRYAERVAEIREKYRAPLASVKWDIIQGGFDAGNYWIYSTSSPVGRVLEEIGAQFASATAAVPAGDKNSVSYERTDLLTDADQIIYYTNSDGSPANDIHKLFALPNFGNLQPVSSGHLLGTPDFLIGSYADALGLLDSIETALQKFT